MLSYDERRRLGHIETWLRVDDPDFADGLRSGLPQAPREYRRWPAVTLLAVGLVVLTVSVLFGIWPAVVPGAVGMAAGTWMWLRRRLDGPATFRRRSG